VADNPRTTHYGMRFVNKTPSENWRLNIT
jgi:hypothetical protein